MGETGKGIEEDFQDFKTFSGGWWILDSHKKYILFLHGV